MTIIFSQASYSGWKKILPLMFQTPNHPGYFPPDWLQFVRASLSYWGVPKTDTTLQMLSDIR